MMCSMTSGLDILSDTVVNIFMDKQEETQVRVKAALVLVRGVREGVVSVDGQEWPGKLPGVILSSFLPLHMMPSELERNWPVARTALCLAHVCEERQPGSVPGLGVAVVHLLRILCLPGIGDSLQANVLRDLAEVMDMVLNSKRQTVRNPVTQAPDMSYSNLRAAVLLECVAVVLNVPKIQPIKPSLVPDCVNRLKRLLDANQGARSHSVGLAWMTRLAELSPVMAGTTDEVTASLAVSLPDALSGCSSADPAIVRAAIRLSVTLVGADTFGKAVSTIIEGIQSLPIKDQMLLAPYVVKLADKAPTPSDAVAFMLPLLQCPILVNAVAPYLDSLARDLNAGVQARIAETCIELLHQEDNTPDQTHIGVSLLGQCAQYSSAPVENVIGLLSQTQQSARVRGNRSVEADASGRWGLVRVAVVGALVRLGALVSGALVPSLQALEAFTSDRDAAVQDRAAEGILVLETGLGAKLFQSTPKAKREKKGERETSKAKTEAPVIAGRRGEEKFSPINQGVEEPRKARRPKPPARRPKPPVPEASGIGRVPATRERERPRPQLIETTETLQDVASDVSVTSASLSTAVSPELPTPQEQVTQRERVAESGKGGFDILQFIPQQPSQTERERDRESGRERERESSNSVSGGMWVSQPQPQSQGVSGRPAPQADSPFQQEDPATLDFANATLANALSISSPCPGSLPHTSTASVVVYEGRDLQVGFKSMSRTDRPITEAYVYIANKTPLAVIGLSVHIDTPYGLSAEIKSDIPIAIGGGRQVRIAVWFSFKGPCSVLPVCRVKYRLEANSPSSYSGSPERHTGREREKTLPDGSLLVQASLPVVITK
ncbi:hypothetical protein KIPB_001830 [Kipferlia bialata]|uniref:Uncharacterized protein n=1 Tax=Kipferlia bialata TaxID=797122 RepID=A0A9K3CR65_9EUKA|nr:hypothetical protein KIPB_001830 [Kipferlia bialata]|eukprot:g1830.t1